MRHRTWMVLAAAATLAACGDSGAPSEPDFQTAVQAWHDEHPVCTVLTASFPYELRLPGREAGRRKYDALVSAGLLTAEPFQKAENDIRGGTRPVAHIRYTATALGGQAMRAPDAAGNTALCFARRKVEKIIEAAPPTETLGVRSVRVRYGWTLADVAPWTDNAGVKAEWPEIARALEPRSGESAALMTQTDTGWRYGPLAK